MNVVRSGRRKFKVMALAPILAIFALACWALASPVGSSPDDDFHLASIWCAAGDKANECHTVSDQGKRAIPEALGKASCFAFRPKQSAACQGTSLDDKQNGFITTSRGNFQGLYPPLYYLTMNPFVTSNIAVSAVLMRIVNILLFVGLTTVLYLLLPVKRRPSLVWGLSISLVPLGLFLVASNNPSAWAIISAGTLWISLVGYFESSGAKKAGLGAMAALSTVLGAGARADAAVYAVVAIVVAAVLTARLNRRWVISALLPFVLAVTAAVFYLSAQQSSFARSGLLGGAAPSQAPSWLHLLVTDFLNVPSLWAGVFGSRGLGWLDTLMPAIVWVGSLGAFAALAFAGLASQSTRKLLAVAIALGALWFFPTYVMVQSGAVVGGQVQPRYILPLIILLGGVALLQVGGASLQLSKAQVVVLVSTLSVANAVALHVNMRRYITGTNVTSWNLNTAAQWWWSIPVSPMTVWVVGSLSFAACLLVIALGTMHARPADGVPHPEAAPVTASQ
ncbi:MAG: DUF2142 domain-containing protein [Dermatophilaceae bacterium]